MLEEVCGAVGLIRLSARAGIDPDADGARLRKGGVLGGDLECNLLESSYLWARMDANGYVR